MELYIVTIDTTFAKKLGNSIQNYGICLANDTTNARERFLLPLRGKLPPNVLGDIFPYVYAYKLDLITKNLNEQNPLWSYVQANPNKEYGQQTKAPFYFSNTDGAEVIAEPNKPQVQQAPPAQVTTPTVVEFKPPEGVTDPVQIAMLKTIFDLTQEVKTIKTQGVGQTAPRKVSVQDLEARFHAPAVAGDQGLNPSSIPIPEVSSVVSFPKGKIDQTTLERLKANIQKSRFEDVDDNGGNLNSGTN
jgi:hypothetical protein